MSIETAKKTCADLFALYRLQADKRDAQEVKLATLLTWAVNQGLIKPAESDQLKAAYG